MSASTVPARLMSTKESSEIAVSWEDQEAMNKFSRLFQRRNLIQASLDGLQSEKEPLEDAINELELEDDDDLTMYKLADSFFHIRVKEARELIEQRLNTLNSKIEAIELDITGLDTEMQSLKEPLYKKFGSSINLD